MLLPLSPEKFSVEVKQETRTAGLKLVKSAMDWLKYPHWLSRLLPSIFRWWRCWFCNIWFWLPCCWWFSASFIDCWDFLMWGGGGLLHCFFMVFIVLMFSYIWCIRWCVVWWSWAFCFQNAIQAGFRNYLALVSVLGGDWGRGARERERELAPWLSLRIFSIIHSTSVMSSSIDVAVDVVIP